jgi:hypothetical protein
MTYIKQEAQLLLLTNFNLYGLRQPIPAAARSVAWVHGRSLAGIVGSNPAGGMDVCLL